MKAITIRGIEPDVSEKIKQAAGKKNKSVNQFIVDMIRQNMGMQKEKKYSKKYDDLDHLFGTWSDADFKNIQEKIDSQRKIDVELWK